MELALPRSVMNEFEDILYERRRTSDLFWAVRNWEPVSAYVQARRYNSKDIKNKALVGAPLNQLLNTLSRSKKVPMKVLKKAASAMMEEIAFKRATAVLRVLAWITSKLTKSLLFGVMVNSSKFLTIKSQFGNNPVLLVPNHRSYGDFILMSFICFYFDVDIPRIAAGMDFQAMSVTSSILRQACAFFMRRSFNTDRLYSAVFEQYVNTLITSGDAAIEFFIEGTRSRTGKSLMPKFGFLKMALKPFFTAVIPDITILPVSFSYDRVMEERLFAFELLGIPKPRESTKGLLRAYMRILNQKLGYVNVNFGDPISAKEFFGGELDRAVHNYGPLAAQRLTSRESGQIARLAHTIVRQQQKLTMITCFNLMATVINQHVSENCAPLTLQKLVSEVAWLSPIMTALGAIVTVEGNLFENVREYIKLHKSFVTIDTDGHIKLLLTPYQNYGGNDRKIRGHRLSNSTMDLAVPFIMLQFYSNPCAYFLVNLCFVSVIAQSKKTGKLSFGELFDEFQFLRSVFANEFVLRKETEKEDFAAAFEFAKNQGAVVELESEIKAGENVKLGQFCVAYVRLYIRSYLMIIDIIFKDRNHLVTNERVSKSYQKAVESTITKNIQIHPASLSLNLVENTIQALTAMNVMRSIRRKHQLSYHVKRQPLKTIRNRLGKFEAVIQSCGKIWNHVDNFLYCKY